MKLKLLVGLLLFGHIHSAEESTSLSSATASYIGNTLSLQGSVVLDHGLGKMKAETAELERQETGKDFPFSLIRLRTQVELQLKDRGELSCQDADFDFEHMKGFLRSGPSHNISYCDKNHVTVTGEQAELTLLKQEVDPKRTTFDIDVLTTEGNVMILYGNGFQLTAPKAIFYRHQRDGIPNHEAGLIIASSPCQLTRGTDLIDAKEGHLFVEEKQLLLKEPKGILGSSLTNGKTHFECNTLSWDERLSQLVLKGNIHIHESLFGSMDTNNELVITQGIDNEKRVITNIEAKEGIRLASTHRYCLADKALFSRATHQLVLLATPGKKVLFWDHEKKMRLAAPEVRITIDPETGEETVQGIGAVRFEFTAEENSLLQSVFNHLKELL